MTASPYRLIIQLIEACQDLFAFKLYLYDGLESDTRFNFGHLAYHFEVPYIKQNLVYIATLAIFVLLQIPTALDSNFGLLLVFWALTSLFRSPSLAIGRASIVDIYVPRKKAYGLSIWGITQTEERTSTIWELISLSGFCLVLLMRRMRKMTGDERLIYEPKTIAGHMTTKYIAMMALTRPIMLNFAEPMFQPFPIAFIEIYGFNLDQGGFAFPELLIGAFIALQFDENGSIKSEKILLPTMVGGLCSAHLSIHWIMPVVDSGFSTILVRCLSREYAASVVADSDLFRSPFGAGFPLFITMTYRNLDVDWASSTLAFFSIAFISIPYVLYILGKGRGR
ncbi:hypothetical protein CC78DRAFT_560287 [Lojkania enalia]|uniref:Uncharacterized protein n=1 Tax=Lojkania enalia TaxID=147567 RepID=A0A9P4KDK7_9PLEO|nr:hypothetical protein CC78DRAFT_560287 [Didymosphaeria enalia]